MSDSHISIRHVRDVEILPEFQEMVRGLDTEPRIEEYERSRVVASIDWATPANVILFVAASISTGFLAKLGSTAAEAVIEAIKAQFLKSKRSNIRGLSANDIQQLMNNPRIQVGESAPGRQLPPFEIDFKIEIAPVPKVVRYVFPASIEEHDIASALEKLRENHAEIISEAHNSTYGGATIAVYVPSECRWLTQQEVITFVMSGRKI